MSIVKIDPSLCIGCGMCSAIADAVFELNGDTGLAEVKIPNGELKTPEEADAATQAKDSCPTQAISIQ